jgi:hypothetical protein
MQATAHSSAPPDTEAKRKRALLISRIAAAVYILVILSAIIRREPREMLLGVVVAVIPVVFGPAAYRVVGVIAALGAFLTTALIQLS